MTRRRKTHDDTRLITIKTRAQLHRCAIDQCAKQQSLYFAATVGHRKIRGVKADVWRAMHPVFQNVKARASWERHIDICMVVAKDEVIHIVILLKLHSKLIQRLFRIFKVIFSIVRQAAVTRPCVAETIGKPRVQHAEEDLKEAAMEDASDDPVAKRHVSESVTMTETKSDAGDIHDTRLFKTFHAELLEVTIGPDVVVSSEEIHIHATVHEFLQGSECADIALWHHIAVFIPEIPDVTEKIHSLSVFRQRTQKVCKAALAGSGIRHLQA